MTQFASCFTARRAAFGLAVLVCAMLAGLAAPRLALAQPTREPASLALIAAVESAAPGAIIEIPPGTYEQLRVLDVSFPDDQPLTLRPADPANPPRFNWLELRQMENVILEGLIFDYVYSPGDVGMYYPFAIYGSRGLTFRNNLFEGDPGPDGFASGVGFLVRENEDIRFENNEVRGFLRGMIVSYTRNIAVIGNNFHSMRSDGMNFAQVNDVLIEGNSIHNFVKNIESGDHPDMIQFWTAGTDSPSTNIVIRNNWLVAGRGDGAWTQSIFIRNELVDTGQAGDELFYRDILIEGNLIMNAHLHGITVGETDGLRILNNTVVRIASAEGTTPNPDLWLPVIALVGPSRDVTVARNVTGGVFLPDTLPLDWVVTDNLIVQDRSRIQPNFYNTVFVGGDPVAPAAFRPLPGGPLDGADLGSPLPQAP